MKKVLLFLLVICMVLSFTACNLKDAVGKLIGRDDDSSDSADNTQTENNGASNNPNTDNSGSGNEDGGNTDGSGNGNEDGGNTGGGDDSGSGSGNVGGNGGSSGSGSSGATHANTEFSASDKDLMNDNIGFVLPFIPCDEYELEEYFETDGDYSYFGVYFSTVGNTTAEFEAYLELLDSYTFDYTEDDDYGDAWYFYSNGDVFIDLVHYHYEGEYYLELYAYVEYEDEDEGDNGNSGNEGGNTDNDDTTTSTKADEWREEYDCITIDEAYDICDEAGENKSDRYYLIGTIVTINDDYYGNMTIKDSTGTLLVYGSYGTDGKDRYGDITGAVPKAGDVVLFYGNFKNYEGTREMYSGWIIDFYTPGASGSGNTGSGSGNEGGNGGYGDGVLTNESAGLPEDSDGVYDVDFTKAEKAKDVTDLGLYIDGCPTTGSPAVLVIPVEFNDSLASSKGYTIDAIKNAFLKDGENDYYSVYDYYYISSYGKLDLDITVLDFWFKPKNNSTYYYNVTEDYYGEDISIGEQLVLDEALAYLAGIMDLSQFDSDNNGTIDAVVLVNTLEINENTDFYWAFRYWNFYTDESDEYYEYDGVSANDYVWASYQFLFEGFDENGDRYFDDDLMNPYTYIHEFAHILGVEDYYDNAYVDHPMAGFDVMDYMTGDHNAYTKINLGWITSSRLVVIKEGSITLTLEDFSENGDTIIIANNWDEKLGAYQEYYVIVYYTNNALNGGEYGYFINDGIVVYHVNAPLYVQSFYGEDYYYIYNTNTDASDDYGTEDNLIEFVKSSNDTYVYLEGYTMPTVTDDFGNVLGYTFTVVSIDGDEAVITFTVKA